MKEDGINKIDMTPSSELHTHINAILSGEGFIDFLAIIFERELVQSKEEMSVIITSKNKEEIRIPLYIKEEIWVPLYIKESKESETIYTRNPTLIKLLGQDNNKPFGDDIIIQVGNRSYAINNDNYLQLYTRRNNILDDLLKKISLQRSIGKSQPTQQDIIDLIVDTYIDIYQKRIDSKNIESLKIMLSIDIEEEIRKIKKSKVSIEEIYINYLKNNITLEKMLENLSDLIDNSLLNEQRKNKLKKRLEINIEDALKRRSMLIDFYFKKYSKKEISYEELVNVFLKLINNSSVARKRKKKLNKELNELNHKKEEIKDLFNRYSNKEISYEKMINDLLELINKSPIKLERINELIKILENLNQHNSEKIEKVKEIIEQVFFSEIEEKVNTAMNNNTTINDIVHIIIETINQEFIMEVKEKLKKKLENKRNELKLLIKRNYNNQTLSEKELIEKIIQDISTNLNDVVIINTKEDPYILLPKYEETRTLIMIEYLLAILKEMENNGKVKYAEISTRNPGKVPAWPDTKLPVVYFFLYQFPHNYEIDKIIGEYVKTDSRFIGIDFAGTELAVNPQEVTKRFEALFEKLIETNNLPNNSST